MRVEGKRMGTVRIALMAVIVLMALIVVLGMAVGTEKEVEVNVDGSITRVSTRARTVAEVLKEAGIDIARWDSVSPSLDSAVAADSTIEVKRALPVCVNHDGETRYLYTLGASVEDVLTVAGVALGPNDRVEPSKDSPVMKDMVINVVRVNRSCVVEEEEILCTTVRREDAGLDEGTEKVVAEGKNGLKRVLREVVSENGRIIESRVISEETVREPSPRLVAVGTGGVISRGGQSIRYKRKLDVIATAYTPGPESNGPYANGLTAIGLKAGPGIVAVDPKVIKLRSRLYVDGYGFGVAGDTGGAIKGNRIDVCFNDLQEALRWGVRRVKVYVLE